MKNRKNEQRENLGKHGPLCCSEGHPRRGVALRHSKGSLTAARLEGKKGHHSGSLQHSLATPWRNTVHMRKFSDFCFRTPRIRTRLFRNLIKY